MVWTEFYLCTKTLEYRIEIYELMHGVIKCYGRGYRMIECEYLIKHR